MERHPVFLQYAADSEGNVFNTATGKRLVGCKNEDGYIKMGFTTDKKKRICSAHHIVYECFHGALSRDQQIDHINAIKTDNALCSLQVLSATDHNRKTFADNPGSWRLSGLARGQPVIRVDKDGNETEFRSVQEAARETHEADQPNIVHCLKGRRRRHRGYTWKYRECTFSSEKGRACLRQPRVEVSSHGRIKGLDGRIGNGHMKGGYRCIFLQRRCFRVHFLVCTAFLGFRPSDSHSVDHINRIKDDNKIENLRWASSREQAMNRSNSKGLPVSRM